MKKITSLIALTCLCMITAKSQTTFITSGSSWKYLDNGTDQGTAWRSTSFVDASWASGNAQLGYGDGDEATVVSYGASSSNKYITTYFRKTVSIASPSSFTDFTMNVKRDDGVVVYINGAEVYRNNLPGGTITYTTLASSAASDDGGGWQMVTLATTSFVSGNNTIAVEIHQNSVSSSDISFDLNLTGNVPGSTTLTRGPYLQLLTPTSVYVRWRTSSATDSKVYFGTNPSALTLNVYDPTSTTEHELQITDLTPSTKYYYSFGTSTSILQGDLDNFFITAPTIGSIEKTRVWVTGDCGTGYTEQTDNLNEYLAFSGGEYTNLWLLLGDNAYTNGTDAEYQSGFFAPYQTSEVMKQTAIFPAPGNHDYYCSVQTDRNTPYYQNFRMPTMGELGGHPSGTEAYYSYNYSNIHFISLDSYGEEDAGTTRLYDTTGAQVTWLKQDLALNTQPWTIVYWHHPPYTKGSHNSDSESDLVAIRSKLIRVLDQYKVDLVLCGHSHCYERSKIMDGHYGNESSFNAAAHNHSTSSAKYDGSTNSCPYIKNTTSPENEGIVYVVAGSAGKLSGTSSGWPHNAMYYSNNSQAGTLFLEIENNKLDAKFICEDGVIRDNFTILKDVNHTTALTIDEGDTVVLSSSWSGSHDWIPAVSTDSSATVSPTSNTTYTVSDSYNCIEDVFNVTVIPCFVSNPTSLNDTICAGGSTVLNASGTGTLNWFTTAAGGSSIFIGTSFTTPALTTTTSYFIEDNNGICSSARTEVTVIVNALPSVGITASATAICIGEAVTLTGTGASLYSWTGGIANATPFTPTTTQTYTVTGTDVNSCENTANIAVTVNNLPAVTFTSTFADTLCLNSPAQTLTGGTPTGGSYSGTGVGGGLFDPSVSGTGTHTLIYSYTDGFGCSNADSIDVVIDLCLGDNATLNNNEGFVIFPNPASKFITIQANQFSNEQMQVTIMDYQSKIIYNSSLTMNPSTTIDISSFEQGEYLIQLEANGNKFTQKFIIKK